jgi:hypothetical protein
MQHFDDIYRRAAVRKGGDQALEALLTPVKADNEFKEAY